MATHVCDQSDELVLDVVVVAAGVEAELESVDDVEVLVPDELLLDELLLDELLLDELLLEELLLDELPERLSVL